MSAMFTSVLHVSLDESRIFPASLNMVFCRSFYCFRLNVSLSHGGVTASCHSKCFYGRWLHF